MYIHICIFILHFCCDAEKRKAGGTQKGLIEKHIYSSKRNKIQVNLVKQLLIDGKHRVQWGSDLSVHSTNGITCDCVTLIGELRLKLPLPCIYGGGQAHYVRSTAIFLRSLVLHTVIDYDYFSNISNWVINLTLAGTTTLDQSWTWSKGNERLLHICKIPRTGESSSDAF